MLLQKISLLKLSELKRHGCPDTPLYADKDSKIVLAHQFLDKNKKSEIKAFQDILDDGFFTEDGQIFSFDALMTQANILNTINAQYKKYIAKLKGNQEKLKEKAIDTASLFKTPIDSYTHQ